MTVRPSHLIAMVLGAGLALCYSGAMHFLANRTFYVKHPGLPGHAYSLGEEIVDFGGWPELIKRSHLEQGIVRQVAGDGDSALSAAEVDGLRQMLQAWQADQLIQTAAVAAESAAVEFSPPPPVEGPEPDGDEAQDNLEAQMAAAPLAQPPVLRRQAKGRR